MQDAVEIEPVYFLTPMEIESQETSGSQWAGRVLHRLTERYVGKVIPSLGLCVAIEEVLEFTPCEVVGSGGSAWLTAVFDVCVFAPSPSTRLRAQILTQSEAGITLQLSFCPAFPILIEAHELVEGSIFDKAAGQWCLPIEEEGHDASVSPPPSNPYRRNEDVVCRVVSCRVHSKDNNEWAEGAEKLMEIRASLRGDCLGPAAWFEEEQTD